MASTFAIGGGPRSKKNLVSDCPGGGGVHGNLIWPTDYMLGHRRRQLAYINLALSIIQRKQDRSAPAQCFLNFGPASQTMDQQ